MRTRSFWSHTFLLDLIRPNGVIFDFGVNYGGFSDMAAALCDRVIGFEPNPYWRENKIALPKNVTVLDKAIASKAGIRSFYLDHKGGPKSSLQPKEGMQTVDVEAITLEDALALQPSGRIELIKIDIEGEELAILQNASEETLRRIVQITVEFEDYHKEDEIHSVIQRIKSIGFWAVKFSWRNYGDVLFVNTKLEPLNLRQRTNVVLVCKYGGGIVRILRRIRGKIW
jgi:FkbM family methyltransferase